MPASLREDYLNQVQRDFLSHRGPSHASTPSECTPEGASRIVGAAGLAGATSLAGRLIARPVRASRTRCFDCARGGAGFCREGNGAPHASTKITPWQLSRAFAPARHSCHARSPPALHLGRQTGASTVAGFAICFKKRPQRPFSQFRHPCKWPPTDNYFNNVS